MKENWKKGKLETVVVTDSRRGFFSHTGHTDVDYYGGCLIAESIYRKKDVALISAAPDMLEAWQSLENNDNSIPPAIWEMVQNAIKKATTY